MKHFIIEKQRFWKRHGCPHSSNKKPVKLSVCYISAKFMNVCIIIFYIFDVPSNAYSVDKKERQDPSESDHKTVRECK